MNDFFSKCYQIRRKLRIWSHLLKKSLIEIFIFYAVHSSVELTSFFLMQHLMIKLYAWTWTHILNKKCVLA